MPIDLAPGATVSRRYVIKRKLGVGGMAEVHLAYDPKLDLDVALKVLPPALLADPSFLARFRREGQTLARLNHPHILRLYEIGEDPEVGLYYLVLEYLTGGTLKDRLTGTPWGVAEAVGVLRPVAAALDYAHQQTPAVVHRDLKPANIMFGDQGRVVVSDFGLARILAPEDAAADHSLSLSWGRYLGTPAYMAPEQVEGRPATPAADRYALGVVTYELLAGGVPFAGETPEATLIQVATKPLPLPRERNPGLDEAAERVVLKALAKDPEARHLSGEALVAALESAGQLTLAPGTVPLLLRVEGSPAGAEVLVDGEPRGHLPCTVLGLRGGPHTVRVAIQGYEPFEQGVVLPRAGPLVVQLAPLSYRLEVLGDPAGAVVAVDGVPAGTLPCWVEGLSAGEHRVSASLAGYRTVEGTVKVPGGGPVVLALDRLRCELEVGGGPAGAAVWIDGTEVGRLPLMARDLAAGGHQVRVAQAGYRAVELSVELPRQTSVHVALERSAPAGYGGFWRRLLALVVDSMLMGILNSALLALPVSTELAVVPVLGGLALSYGYYVVGNGLFGMTVGKWMLGLRVVDGAGGPPGILRALRREVLGKLLSSLGLGLGYLWVAWDPKKQGWHDKIAGTTVQRRHVSTGPRVALAILGGCLVLVLLLSLAGVAYVLATRALPSTEDRGQPPSVVATVTAMLRAGQPSPEAVATATALLRTGERLFGPTDGVLTHRTDNQVATQGSGQTPRDFVVEARFHNPWAAAEGAFDYGFLFRGTGSNQQYRLWVSSDGAWVLNLVAMPADQAVFTEVARGRVTLNTGGDGRNDLILIAREGTGYLYVNGVLVAQLDLSLKQEAGGVSIATGVVTGRSREGSFTRYEGFSVWSLPPS